MVNVIYLIIKVNCLGGCENQQNCIYKLNLKYDLYTYEIKNIITESIVLIIKSLANRKKKRIMTLIFVAAPENLTNFSVGIFKGITCIREFYFTCYLSVIFQRFTT